MIVVDIETSGGDFYKCGILQIGALDIENPENVFLEDAYLGDDSEIVQAENLIDTRTVQEILGINEEQMRDKTKQSEKELLEHFFEWIKSVNVKNFICHGPQFDYAGIKARAIKHGLEIPFYHRCMDLHTIAQTKYFQINGKFLINKDYTDMGLKNTLALCGIVDERKFHNALEDARLEAECFSRLIYGKSLIKGYASIPIPEILRK